MVGKDDRSQPPGCSIRRWDAVRALATLSSHLRVQYVAHMSQSLAPYAQSTLHDIGNAVRLRRAEMGLTQQTLAYISGLSSSTISALEKQSIANLSITRAEELLDAIGLSLRVNSATPSPAHKRPRPNRSALDRAAATASVSYRTEMTAGQLERALLTGDAPDQIRPHLQALLDEAPMSLLANVLDELHLKKRIVRAQAWSQMRRLAQDLQCFRRVWQ
jgi:transcriptional regulator with XRE-family HTH domain